MKIREACENILGKDVVSAMSNARQSTPTIAKEAVMELFLNGDKNFDIEKNVLFLYLSNFK